MASSPLVGGGGGDDDYRDRNHHRFPVENKVYTRKYFNKTHKSHSLSSNPPPSSKPPPPPSSVAAANELDSSHRPTEPPPPLPPANSEDASSSLKRPATPQPEDYPPPLSLVANSHDCRSITISLVSRSRQELREIRQKLVSELEQVRALTKRLEAHELQLAGAAAAAASRTVLPPPAGYTISQFSATDPYTPVAGKKAPEAATTTTGAANPSRHQLSVSVVANDLKHGEGLEKEKRTPKANPYYKNTDFLLGKEKFPPSDSHGHKKSKAYGGKQSGDWSDHVSTHSVEKKLYAQAFKNCSALLTKLLKHRHAWVFDKPVDVKGLGLHDYYSIIKHPMDLGTIKSRLSKNWYKSPHEFAEDVRLTFRNAMTYNSEGQDVHIMAKEMLHLFQERWPAIEAELAYISYPSVAKRLPPLDMRMLERSDSTVHPAVVEIKTKTLHHPLHAGRPPALKKPKAKDLNKRDMTFEEKQKLSNNLQNLPPEKLELIVEIIKRRNLSLSQHDDEIEVDIDSADVETLWELDRFVSNYKKNLSKIKRKAERAIQARQEAEKDAQEMVQARVQEPVVIEAAEKMEKYAASSLPIGGENKGDNASRSSSASSSSSDSGSSLSDSDSDSSSDSDAAHSP